MPYGGGFARYSPLCDTDFDAYKRYLESFEYCVASYGAGIEWSGADLGVEGDAGCDGGGCDDVRNFVMDACRQKVSRLRNTLLLGAVGGSLSGGDSGVDGVGSRAEGLGAGGFAGGGGCDSGGSVVGDGVGSGFFGDASGARAGLADATVLGTTSKGKNWKRNAKKAAAKKERKGKVSSSWRKCAGEMAAASSGEAVKGELSQTGVDSVDWRERAVASSGSEFRRVGEKPKTELQLSLEAKWKAENELRVAKARRELELLEKQDVDAIVRCNEKKLRAATERAMVQTEKAHAALAATDNVPRGVDLGGSVETVVDGEVVPGLSSGSCSISPSSSISEREVRNMMKELEDLKAENKKLKRAEKYAVYQHANAATFTCDSSGNLSEACEEELKARAKKGYYESCREIEYDYNEDGTYGKALTVRVEKALDFDLYYE